MNLVDGVLTAYNLTRGNFEMNLFMRFLWDLSPLVYATGKYFLFWAGIEIVKLESFKARDQKICLVGTFLVFFAINLWHVWLQSRP
jgi:hypothetical protein